MHAKILGVQELARGKKKLYTHVQVGSPSETLAARLATKGFVAVVLTLMGHAVGSTSKFALAAGDRACKSVRLVGVQKLVTAEVPGL